MGFTVSKQTGTWLLIFAIVGAVLIGIQIVRVNSPKPAIVPAEQRIYTQQGPLPVTRIEVGANSYYTYRIDLNRRMKLNGSFRTENLKSTVSVLVLRESELGNWKSGQEVSAVVKTNSVPGGKISPVLEPGVYFLVIDNQKSDQVRVVMTDFVIDSV
jgi:hypothetical protein